MTPALMFLTLAVAAPPEPLFDLRQVAPDSADKPWAAPDRPGANPRAVVLLHGLYLHPVRPAKVSQPMLRDWQKPKSTLVNTLAAEFDVFALGYSQVATVDATAEATGLRDAVERLQKAGYTDIVLVGHSAGGLIAKRFVEVCPTAGATRVVVVAAPFAGVEVAALGVGYRKPQASFVESLAPAARAAATKANPTVLGDDVEIACVVCKLKRRENDGLVKVRSQWTEDLQRLGVPAVLAPVSHFEVMDDPDTAKALLKLAKGKLARWSPDEVDAAKKMLFGEPSERGNFLQRRAR